MFNFDGDLLPIFLRPANIFPCFQYLKKCKISKYQNNCKKCPNYKMFITYLVQFHLLTLMFCRAWSYFDLFLVALSSWSFKSLRSSWCLLLIFETSVSWVMLISSKSLRSFASSWSFFLLLSTWMWNYLLLTVYPVNFNKIQMLQVSHEN